MSAGPTIGKSVDRAVDMAEVAVEKGAVVLCFPELGFVPWFPKQEDPGNFVLAQEPDNVLFLPLKQLSARARVVIIVPFFESSQGKYYNSAAIFDCGELLGVYRKVHLPNIPLYREQFYFSHGDAEFPVFETSRGKIGIQICWDNLFPEGARILALNGAEMIFSPNAASLDSHTLWERAITFNAFANNVFVFRVNRVGQEDGITFYGRSFCADPWGEIVSELAGHKDAIVIADIDLKERAAAAETWGFLKHRRPGDYRDLTK